jgi:hypothetical protein
MTVRDSELLSELRHDPELLAVADALREALRPTRRWVRPVLVGVLVAVAAVASVVGLSVANASAEKHAYDGPDQDVVGGGEPPQAYGIASDEVQSVTAKLDDGRSITADVVDNFYVITLPDGVQPGIPLTLVANLKDGTAVSERVPGG